MQREYFCGGCGLFHWVEQYVTDPNTGRIDYVPYQGCPNKDCISHSERDVAFFAVDTFGWAYFCESHSEFINEVKWSSPQYAPADVIELYRENGVPIR